MSQSLVWVIWVIATGYAGVWLWRYWRLVRQYPEEFWHDYPDYPAQELAPVARAVKGALWYWLAATALLASTYWPGWPESVVLEEAAALFALHGSFATFWPAVRAQLHPSPESPGDSTITPVVDRFDDDED